MTAALAEAAARLPAASAGLDALDRRVGGLLEAVERLHAQADAAEAAERAVQLRQAADAALARVAAREAEREAAREARLRAREERYREREAAALRAAPAPEPEPVPAPEHEAEAVATEEDPGASHRPRRPGVVPSVLFTLGAIAVADAVVTVVWQEPLSRLYASREQAELRGQLRTLEQQTVLPAVRLPPRPADRMADLAAARGRRAAPGRVSIASIDARFVMVQGTGEGALRRGPGHYAGTALPGQRGTVGLAGLAGHRTTYLAPFRRVDELAKGARVRLEMPYGTFDYRVFRTRIVPPSQASVLATTPRDQVVLTACHPLFSAAKRIVETARLLRAVPKGAAVSRDAGGAAGAPPRPA